MTIDRKLRKKLSDWRDEGLLSEEQTRGILIYEENHASTHSFFFMTGWLAAACIVLGIIALIASNWEQIPDLWKLIFYFLIFAGLGCTLTFNRRLTPLWQEILRLSLMAYSMAGIGLVAQIYHLHSSPWRGIAFWCAITLGLALSSQGPWGALLWLPAALFAWFSYIDAIHLPSEWVTVIGIITGGILGIFGSLHHKRVSNLIHFRHISFIFVIIACITFSIVCPSLRHQKFHNEGFFTFLGMALLWSAILWFQPIRYNLGTRMGLLVFLGFTTAQFPLHIAAGPQLWPQLAYTFASCALFIIGTMGLAIAAFADGQKKIFEALCILIFLRLLALYTESLLSLAAKGFGLISVGILLLGGLYAWKKLKPTIYAKLEGELNAKS